MGDSPAVTAIEHIIYSQGAHLEESFSPSTSDAANFYNTYIDTWMLTDQDHDETDEENDSEELPLTVNDITNNRERKNELLKKRREKNSPLIWVMINRCWILKKKDMLISQFEKSNEGLNASISKISKTMESMGYAVQQCVGIIGTLIMQHSSPYQYFMNNQNIQSNATNVTKPNYNAGYDTAQCNFSSYVDEVKDISSNS